MNLGIFYKKKIGNRKNKDDLIGFTDNDYAGDSDDRKNTSEYVYMLVGPQKSNLLSLF